MYLKRFSQILTVLVVLGMLSMISGASVQAAAITGQPGDGPNNAAAVTSGAKVVQPGERQWYVFHVLIPLTGENPGQGNQIRQAKIAVTMDTQQSNVNFEIWTPDMVQKWQNGEKFQPLGAGTENSSLPGDPLHYWTGTFQYPSTLYLVVKNWGTTPATYTLNFSGDPVSFPSDLTIPSTQ